VARYSLILRDATYVRLVEWAGQEHISVGKLLNKLIEAAVRDWERGAAKSLEALNPCCMTCAHYVLRNEWCPCNPV